MKPLYQTYEAFVADVTAAGLYIDKLFKSVYNEAGDNVGYYTEYMGQVTYRSA